MYGYYKKGFTLVELLAVIAVIGLLSVLSVIVLGQTRKSSRDAIRLSNLRDLQGGLEFHYVQSNTYPVAPEPIAIGAPDANCLNSEGFAPLGCSGAFIDDINPDPGDGVYQYMSTDGSDYVIYASLEGEVNGLTGNIQITPSEIRNAQ